MNVHVSWGNSDGKLTQLEWSVFCGKVVWACRHLGAVEVYGEWYSLPSAQYQNACISFRIEEPAGELKEMLAVLAGGFRQVSIAWLGGETEFMRGVPG